MTPSNKDALGLWVVHLIKWLLSPVSMALFLTAIFEVVLLLSWRKLDRLRKLALAALLITHMGTTILSLPLTANWLSWQLEAPYLTSQVRYPQAGSVDVIAVLGSGISQAPLGNLDDLDQFTLSRVVHGVQAFKSSKAQLLVMQGSGGPPNPARMTDLMKNLAVSMGVPATKIKVDAVSRNTWEHPVELTKISGVSADNRIAVVTTARHLNRALTSFTRTFPHVVGVPADFTYNKPARPSLNIVPTVEALRRSSTVILEIIGNIVYNLRN